MLVFSSGHVTRLHVSTTRWSLLFDGGGVFIALQVCIKVKTPSFARMGVMRGREKSEKGERLNEINKK